MHESFWLIKFPKLFMLSVFSATSTVFVESKFIWCIELISFGDVILRATHSTDKSYENALFFFCHIMLLNLRSIQELCSLGKRQGS